MSAKNTIINRPGLIINGKREVPQDISERKIVSGAKKVDIIAFEYSKIPENQRGDSFISKSNLDSAVENMIESLDSGKSYNKIEIRSIVKDYLNSTKNYK